MLLETIIVDKMDILPINNKSIGNIAWPLLRRWCSRKEKDQGVFGALGLFLQGIL